MRYSSTEGWGWELGGSALHCYFYIRSDIFSNQIHGCCILYRWILHINVLPFHSEKAINHNTVCCWHTEHFSCSLLRSRTQLCFYVNYCSYSSNSFFLTSLSLFSLKHPDQKMKCKKPQSPLSLRPSCVIALTGTVSNDTGDSFQNVKCCEDSPNANGIECIWWALMNNNQSTNCSQKSMQKWSETKQSDPKKKKTPGKNPG